jgi:molybdopterin-guanine dinucleotide biosynthesis protein A
LRAYLGSRQRGSLAEFVDRLGGLRVPFPRSNPDPFFNINTPEDLAEAAALMGCRDDGGSPSAAG